MPSSDAHIHKRQYHPSHQTRLDSYLHRSGSDVLHRKAVSPLSPQLPSETAASLLNVGMRVRKSVPEGYKTHKTLGSSGFPFPSTAPAAIPVPTASSSTLQTRELTPFCGLHKIGGWAAQDIPSASAPPSMRHDEAEDEIPGLSMSQGTSISSQNSYIAMPSAPRPPNKRTYEEEMEQLDDDILSEMDQDGPTFAEDYKVGRPMAKLKNSRRKPAWDPVVPKHTLDDFEEASFLVPRQGMDISQ